jgi:putative ABC transport system permease protein
MHIKDIFKMAISGLSTHKTRSALTILGIVIGITAITIVTSLGNSAEQLILGELQTLGPNNVFVIPGRQDASFSSGSALLTDSLKEKDLKALSKKANVPDATAVVPVVFGPVLVSYEAESYATTILGGGVGIEDIYGLNMELGVFFTSDEVSQRGEVVVLGSKIAEELFGDSDVIGEKVKMKDKSFRVIGVMEKKGQGPFIDFDEVAVTPYTTAQQYVLGYKYIQRIAISISKDSNIRDSVKDVEQTLRDSHDITDPDKDDFFVQTQEDLMETLSTITSVLTILLTSIAAISLVVGGVGIMNIMLVSVTERTREIGLRKALGAKNKNILGQFLVEAVLLTGVGGVLGIIFGLTFSYVATVIAYQFLGVDFPFSSPVSGALLGIGVSTIIGFIFGIYPAHQASKKSPMEALRYE